MLRASVAQKPILAVSAGKKKVQNCPSFGPPTSNCDGRASIGPRPPAALQAQASKAKPSPINNGALMFSDSRIDSTPRYTTSMLTPQKPRKQSVCGRLIPSSDNGGASRQTGK